MICTLQKIVSLDSKIVVSRDDDYMYVHAYLSYIGEDETRIQQLRSILAQLEFQFQVCQWEDSGIPFRQHIYVPEIHPITGQVFHEREDEGHVFKVCFPSLFSCICIIYIIGRMYVCNGVEQY